MAAHSSVLAGRIPLDRGAWSAALRGVAKSPDATEPLDRVPRLWRSGKEQGLATATALGGSRDPRTGGGTAVTRRLAQREVSCEEEAVGVSKAGSRRGVPGTVCWKHGIH